MKELSGKILNNRYILLEKVGDGGMALVFKAKDTLLNRFVAVKILRPEFANDTEFLSKFKRESMAAASLSHPNIVSIFDVGENDGLNYIVMEYIKGKTLKDYIKEKGKIKYDEALRIILQISQALDHAHKNGVVHRDVKPHNILITEDNIIKVTDFGIARASTFNTVTNTGKVMGSVHYLSPEQARGVYSDHRTDIYSLGVVFYEMLIGRPPYDAESPITIAIKHIQDEIEEPIKVDPNIPIAVNDIVVKMMQKDMTRRYQNAKEIIMDINRAINNPGISLLNKGDDIEKTRIISQESIEDELNKSKAKGKRNKKPLIISIVIILFLSITALGYFVFNKYFVIKDVKVPNVVGLSEEEARKIFESNKLIMEIEGTQSSDLPEGTVISTIPEEGTTVKENSVVKVIVSSGPKMVAVPDLKGLDLTYAETLLRKYKLTLGNIEKQYSDEIQKGFIIDQNPLSGSEVKEGTAIDIILSDGPQIKIVKVPNLLGMSLEQAKQTLKLSGLNLGIVNYGYDPNYKDGEIILQSVVDGVEVRQGTLINVTVNKLDDNLQQQENDNQ
ncbi:Stk1 family PASTA domain-containing Ser/Thr kinase [Caloramator sp. Dgby_cultured_2]|uniref:Stk1 family PASTA domain-containing Ser/Thr kinase n=1 Tax=Caloramator sp. Dgby_cultured_2 TaxID=3029174 RepID=UPI00237E4987|nr:Stk1 family PASTA domain-containing Ser/Thr kinase [Caloramator sp. Dgby_cultured_2]WDU84074.1 Stk1 family PASTA domain-containing Ser/Thr kinase [Caloramator sp. Dgby_cultured_2]